MSTPAASGQIWRFKALVLLGAVLLFGVEPLVGKLVLPAHGGSFHVWATCLTFFQGALFLGYLYCHVLAPRLGRGHLLLLGLPVVSLPLTGLLAFQGRPDPHAPVLSLLAYLLVSVGLPFGLLATTAVVAQRWLHRSGLPEARDPYPLYAASNLGSIVALLGYPIAIEPFVGLRVQRYAWCAGYLVYLALAVLTYPRRGGADAPPEPAEPAAAEDDAASAPSPGPLRPPRVLYWFLLSMAPSAFLIAVTNVIAVDVGSMPLVWVVPLVIYLLSFVIVFRRGSRGPWLVVRRFWPEATLVGVYLFATSSSGVGLGSGAAHLAALAFVCLAGHGELHRVRPAPGQLTAYYLVLSLGGWAGGLLVSFVAPVFFTGLWEYPLAAAVLAAAMVVGRWRDLLRWLREEPFPLLVGSCVLVALVGASLVEYEVISGRRRPLHTTRNFYGVYRVTTQRDPPARRLYHGTTLHGRQLLEPPGRGLPVSYYHPRSGLGDVMRLTADRRRRTAVIGLGAGTTAAYFGPEEEVVFYELDPDVERIAAEWFTYLDDCAADWRVVPGDARVSLDDDPGAGPAGFDVILVDAFSSDAIPTHLLTREALALYERRLAEGGYVVFHVSNRYYELRPVLRATAAGLFETAFKARGRDLAEHEDATDYCVMRRPEDGLDRLLRLKGWRSGAELDHLPELTPWTDDYASVLVPLWLEWTD